MEALANSGDQYQLIKVDVANWGSPVDEQFGISSLPSFVIIDKDGKEVNRGKPARQYIRQLVGQ